MNQPSKRAKQRQDELNRTAFRRDTSMPQANTCGLRWQDGGDLAAIEDVEEFEYCFPGQPATHENAARIVALVLANPRHRWYSDFLRAEHRAAVRFEEHAAEARADYASDAMASGRGW